MNVLFLSQVLPYPLDAGPKVRSFYNISYLSQHHAITLLSFVRDSDTLSSFQYLESICSRVVGVKMPRSRIRDLFAAIQSITKQEPFLITRDANQEMVSKIKEMVHEERFDIIHADQLWMAPYAIIARDEAIKTGYRPKLVLDQHNAVFMVPKRMAGSTGNPLVKIWLKREARLMARYEGSICNQFDDVVWVTQEDKEAVHSQNSHKTPKHGDDVAQKNQPGESVIPICFDPSNVVSFSAIPKTENILFLGGMHWPPNAEGITWFVEKVFPQIASSTPGAHLFAIGRNPPKILSTLEDQVTAPGFVENTDEIWHTTRVFVVPLLAGGGMRVKILDAWMRGIPVVSTTIGAEGIGYTDGLDILIADTPEAFAKKVQRILEDDVLASEIGRQGRKTIETKYDWKKIYPMWDQIYQSRDGY